MGCNMLFDLRAKERKEELFGRDDELLEMLRLIEAGKWVAVLGSRMTGKSSLVKTAGFELSKHGYRFLYVNLLGVRNAEGFVSALIDAINRSKSLFEKTKDFFSMVDGLQLGVGGLSLKASRKPLHTASDIFLALGLLKENVVIALDEVQELSSFSGRLLEILGRVFATYRNISFIFTGSMFGLMRTLLEPSAKSPLYGRPPARIVLSPFTADAAAEFLHAGFSELGIETDTTKIGDVLERLDGIPGWLTLYGSKAGVERLSHEVALTETGKEAEKIVIAELENFLAGRNKELYLAVMRATTYGARWGEIRKSVEARIGVVNNARLSAVLKSLKAAMFIEEKEGFYRMIDPIVRGVVLTSKPFSF